MSHVFHRSLKASYPVAKKGEGVYITDHNNKRYIDACGGAAVSCLGYSHRRLKDAIIEQIETLPFVHSSFFTTDVLEECATELINGTQGVMSHVYFVSGGSEAIEAAIKMARQYFVDTDPLLCLPPFPSPSLPSLVSPLLSFPLSHT